MSEPSEPRTPHDDLLTVQQAADELGVGVRRVRQLIAARVIPVITPNPRLHLIRRQDLAAAKGRETKRGPKPNPDSPA